MVAIFANNATGKLGGDITTSSTTLILQTGNGALFPAPTGGNYFPITVVKDDGTLEIMKCTARSVDTLTVTRSQEGTTAKAFTIGDRVSLRMTAGSLVDFIGNKQPLNATLTALAGLTTSADKLIYATGSNVFAITALTAFARTLLDDADAAALCTTIGLSWCNNSYGMIAAFAANVIPTGWLKCNGAAVSRTTYANLFARIGTIYGAGDGSTTFNLPDLRGETIRGWDDARGVDSGRAIGSWQDGQNVSHTHTGTTSSDSHTHTWSGTTSSDSHTHTLAIYIDGGAISGKVSSARSANTNGTASTSSNSHTHTVSGTTSSNAHTHTMTTSASGDTEVRVRNVAMNYCIKY